MKLEHPKEKAIEKERVIQVILGGPSGHVSGRDMDGNVSNGVRDLKGFLNNTRPMYLYSSRLKNGESRAQPSGKTHGKHDRPEILFCAGTKQEFRECHLPQQHGQPSSGSK